VQVFITGRRQSELDKAVAAIGGNVMAIHGDVSKLADIDRIKAAVFLASDDSAYVTGIELTVDGGVAQY
jgi:NAD(P)-dependent dehydrogenase (short-subunit alcohol dehydrogenase family)